MSYSDQNKFFAQAYRTGTDTWSSIPFNRRAHELSKVLHKGSLVLDLGTGRGKTLFELGDLGYRVIGLENNAELVARGNEEIQTKGREKDLRFFHGDALDIPLADQSFDAAVDVGLLQHLYVEDHAAYVREIARVLKHDGYFFLITLSKDSPAYLSWHPVRDDTSDHESEGVHYHFFSDDELRALFEKDFEIKELAHDSPFGPADAIFAVLLLKKK